MNDFTLDNVNEMYIGTFHSLCLRIISEREMQQLLWQA